MPSALPRPLPTMFLLAAERAARTASRDGVESQAPTDMLQRRAVLLAAGIFGAGAILVVAVDRWRRWRRRRRRRVLGLCGPSAAGKSYVCAHLATTCRDGVTVIACDDYYLPNERCPRFDLGALPWPGGLPAAFEARGNADLNHPAAVDWDGVRAAVRRAASGPPRLIVVEGLLLFGDHPGARSVRKLCDGFALLSASAADAAAMDRLLERKWQRSHLGKRSYRDRGVTKEEYKVYWDGYIWPTWIEHGASRCPPGALVLDALAPPAENAARLLRLK